MRPGIPEKAETAFISLKRIRRGPPAPHGTWTRDAILSLFRSVGIDAQDVLNYFMVRHPLTRKIEGYKIYYRGEPLTQAHIAKLH